MQCRRDLLTSGAAAALSWPIQRTALFHGRSGATALDISFLSGALDPRVTFSRASVGTYFDVTGTMQTAGNNIARFDYDPMTHAAQGLLIEESRTNLLLNSATLGTQSVTVTAQAYTLSFYGTGTITKSGTATGALVGTGAFPQRVSQTFTPTAGTLTLTVSGSVVSAQLEAGAFPTSYIPTTAAAVTRAVDAASIPGTYVQSGSLVADFAWLNVATSQVVVALGTSGDLSANAINLRTASVSPAQITGTVVVANGIAANIPTSNSYTQGSLARCGFTYTPTAETVCLNGGTVASGSTTSVPATLNIISLAFGRGSVTGTGYTRRIRYWGRVLSNTELQQATA